MPALPLIKQSTSRKCSRRSLWKGWVAMIQCSVNFWHHEESTVLVCWILQQFHAMTWNNWQAPGLDTLCSAQHQHPREDMQISIWIQSRPIYLMASWTTRCFWSGYLVDMRPMIFHSLCLRTWRKMLLGFATLLSTVRKRSPLANISWRRLCIMSCGRPLLITLKN